jgi:hypothetical protein
MPLIVFLLTKSRQNHRVITWTCAALFVDGLWALFGGHGIFLGNTMSYAMGAITLPLFIHIWRNV